MVYILPPVAMRRRDYTRLCEWADLVDADLPEEFACETDHSRSDGRLRESYRE